MSPTASSASSGLSNLRQSAILRDLCLPRTTRSIPGPGRRARRRGGASSSASPAAPSSSASSSWRQLLGSLGGVLFAYGTDLPEISRLDDYQPSTITRLLARDGQRRGAVRHRTARRRPLRGHRPDAAPGDHRQGGRRLRAALRPEHHPHRGRRRQGRVSTGSAAAPAPSPSSWRATCSCASTCAVACSSAPDSKGSSGRSRNGWSRSSSNGATRSARSSPSTPTRSISVTARTASRRPRGCTSTSRPRT